MAKKGMSMGKMIMTILAIVCGLAICLPLFINVWNGVGTIGDTTTVAPLLGEEVFSGYFSDYSNIVTAFELYDATFMAWASMVAGIALIVALVGAVVFILGAIMNMVTGGNKTTNMMTKLGSIVMLIAGVVIVIASLLVVIPVGSATAFGVTQSVSASLGAGAWIGMIAPIVAGVLGMMTSKN